MRKQIHPEANEPELGMMRNMQYNRNRNFKSKSMYNRGQSVSPEGTPQSIRAYQSHIAPPERQPPEPQIPNFSKNNGHLANHSNHIEPEVCSGVSHQNNHEADIPKP